MKRVLEILLYCSNALSAITKGAQVANDNWPTNNPFSSSISGNGKVSEQSGQLGQSVGDMAK